VRTRSVSVFCEPAADNSPHSPDWWRFADTNSRRWEVRIGRTDLFPGLLEVVNLEINQTISIVNRHFHLDQGSNANETGDFGAV